MQNKQKATILSEDFSLELGSLMTSVIILLLPIFIFSIVQIIKVGNEKDYLLLFIGCILSSAFTFGYMAKGQKRNMRTMLLSLAGFIPWIFGLYIFFVRGIGSVFELKNDFSFVVILKAIIFIFIGYKLLGKFYQITEIFNQKVNDNIIVGDQEEMLLEKSKISDEEYTQKAKEMNEREKGDSEQEKRNIAWMQESEQIPEGDYEKMPKRIQIIGSPHQKPKIR